MRTERRAWQEDWSLAQQAADGDTAAWDEVILRYGRKIYNLAYQFSRRPEEAEDLTQEIFLKLYRNLDRYRGDVPLAGWTLRLSRNLCIEKYRRHRLERRARRMPEEMLEELPATDDPQGAAQRRQRLRTVRRAMAEMSQDLATVVLLRDLQGWSYEEVAAFLEVPMGTLKSRLVRARRDLAERVAQLIAPPAPPPSTSTKGGTPEVTLC
jgi:RNA polymerase sigma-70 factor (ECF subfamily)